MSIRCLSVAIDWWNEVECMTVPQEQLRNRSIRRGLRVQSLVSLLLAGGLLLVNPVAAYSSLFGSLAAFIPSLFFALLVVPKFGPDSAAFLRTVVMAEAGKILLTALLCVAVFIWVKPLAAEWFFTAMVVVIFSGRLGMFYRA